MANDRELVVCPKNPTWLARMLEVLPPGLRGKLAVYENCPAVQEEQGADQHRSNGFRHGVRNVIRPVVH